MGLFLFRFWPVLIPFIVYWLWLKYVGRKATIDGRPVLKFRDGPWYWAVLASFAIAMLCFAFLGASQHENRGEYVPPHMEDGTLVPGKIESKP